MKQPRLPLPAIPRQRGPTDFVPIATLLPPSPLHACGSLKPVSGRAPLRCTQPPGHDGDHGMHDTRGLLFVRWGRE